MATTMAAGLGGLVVARSLRWSARGTEYAAITAWFGVLYVVGQMGLPAALCFYVAKDPKRAQDYVATARTMMLHAGTIALLAGLLLAPLLSRGNWELAVGYRIAFGTSIVTYLGTAYIYPLQAKNLLQWNIVRATQPILSLFVLCILWYLRLLTLDLALIILAGTLTIQLGWAYACCPAKLTRARTPTDFAAATACWVRHRADSGTDTCHPERAARSTSVVADGAACRPWQVRHRCVADVASTPACYRRRQRLVSTTGG